MAATKRIPIESFCSYHQDVEVGTDISKVDDVLNPTGAIYEERTVIFATASDGHRWIYRKTYTEDQGVEVAETLAMMNGVNSINPLHWSSKHASYRSPEWRECECERQAEEQWMQANQRLDKYSERKLKKKSE